MARELGVQAVLQICHRSQHPTAKAETQHRMLARPVPIFFCVQPGEQRLIAFEQLLERVEKQAFTKAPRA